LCKKASNQLHAISRLQTYLGFKEKAVLIQSFFYANFNYCSLLWHFTSSTSRQKIEKLQERALRLLYQDYQSSYSNLLVTSGKTTMEIKRLRTVGIEIFKTLHDLNPSYMKSIFQRTTQLSHRPNNLIVHYHRTTRHGDKSLKTLGPRIWNTPPENLKAETNFEIFRRLINEWSGPCCKCRLCIKWKADAIFWL